MHRNDCPAGRSRAAPPRRGREELQQQEHPDDRQESRLELGVARARAQKGG
jgi:hypothetical protein